MNESLNWTDKKMSSYYKDKEQQGFNNAIENVVEDIYNELDTIKELIQQNKKG